MKTKLKLMLRLKQLAKVIFEIILSFAFVIVIVGFVLLANSTKEDNARWFMYILAGLIFVIWIIFIVACFSQKKQTIIKKSFYFHLFPNNIPGFDQKVLLLINGTDKYGIIECPDSQTYHPFDSKEVEDTMHEFNVVPKQPKNIESFDAIINHFPECKGEISRELIENFILMNN
jgi:hypothetical protein